jgi:autotransporter-associated beta strand protein
MPTDRSLARWRSRKGLRIAALLGGVSLSAVAAHAQNATWNLNGTGDFNTNINWTPATVPTGTASFGVSSQNNVTFSSPNTTVGGWTFNLGSPASNYTFTINSSQSVMFVGAGIVLNLSGFSTNTVTIANNGALVFGNSSTAGEPTAIAAPLFASTIITSGVTSFFGTSTGGTARLIANAGGVVDLSGLTSAGMTAGSIEGAGTIFLGSKNLTVGGNALSTTFSGVISGNGGSLTKVGTGTLILTGNNTYTGPTTVNPSGFGAASPVSIFEVDGSIAQSSLTTVSSFVDREGRLTGTGTVGSTQIINGGALAPGNAANPTGTLTIAGNLVFNNGTYRVTLNGSAASSTNVTGTASLASGDVSAQINPGSVTNNYNILHAAGGLGGTRFDSFEHNPLQPGFSASLTTPIPTCS